VDWYEGLLRTRAAVNLVLDDVEHEVGTDVVRIEFEEAGKLRLGGPHAEIVGAKTRIALGGDLTAAPWEYFVSRTAQDIQEIVQETCDRLFPRCPEHEYHAMNAEPDRGVASWRCPGGTFTVAIGALGEPEPIDDPTGSGGS
jgi:hypothetical protein